MPTKYFEGLNPHLATTAPPMATLAATNAAKPLRSVSPRQPQTMPATMARNWKTTPFTLALLATFSGSMTMSFLPECGVFGAGTTRGQRDAFLLRSDRRIWRGNDEGIFATREGAPTAGRAPDRAGRVRGRTCGLSGHLLASRTRVLSPALERVSLGRMRGRPSGCAGLVCARSRAGHCCVRGAARAVKVRMKMRRGRGTESRRPSWSRR